MTAPFAQPPQKLLARNRLQIIAVVEIAAHEPLDFGQIALGDLAQRCQQVEDSVIGKPIINEFAVAPGCHKAGAPHVLEMLRGIGNRQTCALRQNLDAALALGDLFQQLKAMGMPERFRNNGELGEQRLFRTLA